MLSVIIPVFNERDHIQAVIARVKASLARQKLDAEIIVVDDGSTDGSADIIRSIPGIAGLYLDRNRGKGAAVKAGFKKATGDILLIQDADLEYNPDDYSAMIAPLVNGGSDASMGSRFRGEKPVFLGRNKSPYFTHYLGNLLLIQLTNLLYGARTTDCAACYKAFRRSLVESIEVRSNGFEYDNELICKILKRGHRISEVPVDYHPRTYEHGKKITWRHGVRMLWTIFKCRWFD